MVFTSRIEVFGVKPDFRFSFIINQFHNDLFLKGLLYFQKTHSCISERTRQATWEHRLTMEAYLQATAYAADPF